MPERFGCPSVIVLCVYTAHACSFNYKSDYSRRWSFGPILHNGARSRSGSACILIIYTHPLQSMPQLLNFFFCCAHLQRGQVARMSDRESCGMDCNARRCSACMYIYTQRYERRNTVAIVHVTISLTLLSMVNVRFYCHDLLMMIDGKSLIEQNNCCSLFKMNVVNTTVNIL